MDIKKIESWLDEVLPKHRRLTHSVATILENLLKANNIDYLTVTGRSKDRKSSLEKIKRKGYKSPASQLTDLSGIRVIVYFESDVEKVSNLIDDAFYIDQENSLNQDDLLSADQIGYRSVHFVCDLGEKRGSLPEFNELSNLKFEFQVRTVLQHAWAELAHDRNYKFSGKLPKDIERKLYLYAGMLEIADKGFDELSKQIDKYIDSLQERAEKGELNTEVNSISLFQFVESWCQENGIKLVPHPSKTQYSVLIDELRQFGINTLSELNDIIPDNYSSACKAKNYSTTIYGFVRDWMLICDWRRFIRDVEMGWVMALPHIYEEFFEPEEFREFYRSFEWEEDNEEYDEYNG